MANKSLVTTAIGLVVGAAVALLLVPPKRFTTWGIMVGDSASPGDPSHISLPDLRMYRADQVHWQAFENGKGTFIEFEKQIFQKMTFNSATQRYRVTCVGDACNSNTLLSSAQDNVWYKYWQGLSDPNAPSGIRWADGRIIIIKP